MTLQLPSKDWLPKRVEEISWSRVYKKNTPQWLRVDFFTHYLWRTKGLEAITRTKYTVWSLSIVWECGERKPTNGPMETYFNIVAEDYSDDSPRDSKDKCDELIWHFHRGEHSPREPMDILLIKNVSPLTDPLGVSLFVFRRFSRRLSSPREPMDTLLI